MNGEVEAYLRHRYRKVTVDRRGRRYDVFTVRLSSPPEDPWFLQEMHEVKERFPEESFRVRFAWRQRGKRFSVDVPHNVHSLGVIPPQEWDYPYYPRNSVSHHETKGKFRVLIEKRPPLFHDDVKVSIHGRPGEVDLVFPHREGIHVVEIINGKNFNPTATVAKKLEFINHLRKNGFPVDKLMLYFVPRSQSSFLKTFARQIQNTLGLYDFPGAEIWVTGPFHRKIHRLKVK